MYGKLINKIMPNKSIIYWSLLADIPGTVLVFLAIINFKNASDALWGGESLLTAGFIFLALGGILWAIASIIQISNKAQISQVIELYETGIIAVFKTSSTGTYKLNCKYNAISNVVCENGDIVLYMKSGTIARFVNMKDAYNGTAYIKRMISKQENIPYANTMQYHQ